MTQLIIIILIAIGSWLISIRIIKSRTRRLPNVSDATFLQKFNAAFPDIPNELVLQERKYLATQLGISAQKLDPSYTFAELSNYLNLLGSYDLAIGDLENELSTLFEKQGIIKPYNKPSNVGELIFEIIKNKMISTDIVEKNGHS